MASEYPRIVQFVYAQSGSQASLTTAAINTTAGNGILVFATSDQNRLGTIASKISDNDSGTFIEVLAAPAADHCAGAVYRQAIAGKVGHTFTVTPSANDFLSICVFEIEGYKSGAMIGNKTSTRGNATPHASGTITAGANKALFIGGSGSSNGAPAIIINNKWLQAVSLTNGSVQGLAAGMRFAAPGVTDEIQYTSNGSNETVMIVEIQGADIAVDSSSSASGDSGEHFYPFLG